jgi:TonB family protein
MRLKNALPVIVFALLAMARNSAAAEIPRWLAIESTHGVENLELFYRAVTTYDSNPVGNSKFDVHRSADFSWQSKEPGIEGRWAFFGVDGAPAPQSAIRLRMPTGASYRVRAELFCEPSACGALRDFLSKLSPPEVYGNAALVKDWHRVIAEEPCDPLLPASRPPLVYPREEQRREIEGTVVASVFHNRCGDVRDVDIVTSSGNRNLDRMARKQLLRSRVKPAKFNTAGWKRETFEFRLDNPELPPRPKPIDVPAI